MHLPDTPNPAALAGAAGSAGIFEWAGHPEDTAFHPCSQHIALRMLRRRFGLAPSTARIIVELAGFGGAGAA